MLHSIKPRLSLRGNTYSLLLAAGRETSEANIVRETLSIDPPSTFDKKRFIEQRTFVVPFHKNFDV